jgi:hypothetical protein
MPMAFHRNGDQLSGCWKFATKTVVLDSRQVDTLLAIPI